MRSTASDRYSLGCVLYEMLAGEPPFTGRTPQAVIARRLLEPPPALRLARAAVPEGLERVVLRALAREPVDRFRSTAEFAGALGTASLAGAASSPTTVATTLRSRSSRRLLRLGLATMLGLGAAASALLWHREAAPAALDADLVAVAPFDVLDPALGLWREGLVDLLSRDLDGAGPLRTVSPTVIVRRWRGRADPSSAAALGRRTGAELAIYGSLVRSGADSLRLAATVLDVRRERALGELEVRGALTDMDRLTDSVAVGVLRELGRTRPVGAVRRTGLGARSLPALRAFLQAEQHYRRGAWDSARVYAEQAVALDTTFALAYRRLGWTIGWEGDAGDPDPISNEYRERAATLNHGLAPRDSLLVLADSLLQNLDYSISVLGLTASPALGARLFATLEEAVRRYPEDPEAWYTLGEARYHHGVWLVPTEGWRSPLEAFERSIALDSLFMPAYVHPVELSVALGDTARARRFAAAVIRFNPTSEQARGFQAVWRLLALPDTAAQARMIDSLRDPIFWQAYQPLARWPDSSELAVRIARHWARSSQTQEARFHLAHALAFRGHLGEALALGDTVSDVVFAEAALLGYVPAERATARFSRWLRLVDWPPFLPVPALAIPWWGAQRDTLTLRRFVHLVDTIASGTVRARRRLPPGNAWSRRGLAPEESLCVGQMLAAGNAQIALARRDTAAALRAYDSLLDAPCSPWCQTDLLLAGRLLAARGRLDAAARVLDAPPMIEGGTTALSPDPRPSDVLWYLERARIAERLGHRERAIDAYRYVAAAWRRPDPELEPYAAEARGGLARLTAEPRP